MPIYSTVEEAMMAMEQQSFDFMSEIDGLIPQQQEQYNFYEAQVARYGQYDPGILGNGAHYGPNSPFGEEGLVCNRLILQKD